MVKQRRHGLALIDVIIGSVMLAVGLAIVISMSSRSLLRQGDAERQITASWLADEIFAMILVVGPEEYEKTYPDSGEFEQPFKQFSYQIEIEEGATYYSPVDAQVTIFWDVAGNKHNVKMETKIARRHGEEQDRAPAEPIDREARYWEEIEANQ